MAQFAFVSRPTAFAVLADRSGLSDVSLISEGPALGHGLFVDEMSLETVLESVPARLPAYITHAGAIFGDRFTQAIGYWQNARIDDDRVMADFVPFDSFRNDDPRFARLFEMAEAMPDQFGVSIVFEGTQAWATPDGDVPTLGENRPDNARFESPSIRVSAVSSGDFVENPAANERGLFAKLNKHTSIDMTKAELEQANDELKATNETLSAKVADFDTVVSERIELSNELEVAKIELDEMQAKLDEKTEAEATRTREFAEATEKLDESEKALAETKDLLSKAKSEVEKLRRITEGIDPVEFEDAGDDYEPRESARDKAIANYMGEHNCDERTAILAVGAKNPELFES